MEVYRGILPDTYLLVLLSLKANPTSRALTTALHQASCSGKANIWIDCSGLQHLSTKEAALLLRYYHRLRCRNVQLVLCHLTPAAEQIFLALAPAGGPPMVSTLLDAERYCRQHQAAASL